MMQETNGESLQDNSLQTRIDQLEQNLHRLSHALDELGAERQPRYGATSAHAAPGGMHSGSIAFDQQGGGAARSGSQGPQGFPTARARMIRNLLRQRRQREQYFPADIFADPAWDMMLDLYAAHFERRSVSVSSLCIAAAVPATTALRWIKTMTDAGLFVRTKDPNDGRRIYIYLNEGTRERLDEYFDNLES